MSERPDMRLAEVRHPYVYTTMSISHVYMTSHPYQPEPWLAFYTHNDDVSVQTAAECYKAGSFEQTGVVAVVKDQLVIQWKFKKGTRG